MHLISLKRLLWNAPIWPFSDFSHKREWKVNSTNFVEVKRISSEVPVRSTSSYKCSVSKLNAGEDIAVGLFQVKCSKFTSEVFTCCSFSCCNYVVISFVPSSSSEGRPNKFCMEAHLLYENCKTLKVIRCRSPFSPDLQILKGKELLQLILWIIKVAYVIFTSPHHLEIEREV